MSFTIGLVEFIDGRVLAVFPEMIKFIDRCPSEKYDDNQ